MDIMNILASSSYKLTQPRREVFNALQKEKHPVSARNLHGKIKKIDLASVYRTLNLFEELNIVQGEIIDKEKFYCLAFHPHHHIVCRKCGYVEDVECRKDEFEHVKNFTNIRHQLTMTGVCNKCNN